MKRIFTTALFIISICVFKSNYLIAQINTQDSLALIDFYNSTKGSQWIYNTNWLTTAPVSTWIGITVEGDRVTAMNLNNNAVNGPIPESFGNLTALKSFSANYGIKGTLPYSIGKLTSLQSLSIFFCNQLDGHLPASIGNLKNLETLYLYSDNITGTLPSSLGNLSKLKTLNIAGSLLKGSIPASFNNLANLETLDLSFNRLSGSVPSLSNLTHLSSLRLQFNSFTFAGMENVVRNFPFAAYSSQRNVLVNNNNNTLSVYASGANALPDNTYKWYKGSALVATITGDSTYQPTQSGNYSVAVTNSVATALTLYSDTVYVKTTVNVSDSLALVDLYNSTDGPNWYGSPNWLTSAPVSAWYGVVLSGNRVSELHLGHNNLGGKIPLSIGNLTTLTSLDLSFNHHIAGHIPWTLGKLVNLVYINFNYNKLTGSIPPALGNLTKLVELNAEGNRLSDSIPSSLGNLLNLKVLDLAGNRLSGSIPAELGNLTNLTNLSLLINRLTGNIPSALGNLTKVVSMTLQNNQLSGSIPHKLGNLKALSNFQLYGNQLTGEIPKEIGNCTNLAILEIDGNQLTGKIPDSFNKLVNLQVVDISVNQLSGPVPSLDSLTHLQNLYMRLNAFTFSGLERLATDLPFADYTPQANIRLNKNGNTLSVSAGGQLQHNTYKWYKGSTLVSTVKGDSTFQPQESGNYSVAVTNSVATALTLYSDTVNYTLSDNLIASGICNKILSIFVYPNPAKTNTTLAFNTVGKYTITITDVSGKMVQTKTGVSVKGGNIVQLNVNKYASGMYLITITNSNNQKQTIRLNKE